MKEENLIYRPCVGVFLFNEAGLVFLGQRDEKNLIDAQLYKKKHLWQLPQGGIDEGEEPKKAFARELFEETGITKFEIIAEYPSWLSYDLPNHLIGKALENKFIGQRQKWFAARFLGVDSDINLKAHSPAEFVGWRWAHIDELLELVVPFKADIYKKLTAEFKNLVS